MKKRVKSTVMSAAAVMLSAVMTVPVVAVTLPETDPGWYVTFTSEGKMNSNFEKDKMDEVIPGLQPGDEVVIRITAKNEYADTTDWYMDNKVLYSLEERSSTAKGGAYTYQLTFTSDNATDSRTIFDSESVGGDDISAAGEGLKEATDSLKEWFRLGTLENGQGGVLELHVTLEGETQGNIYQDTFADLQFDFAVELPETKTVTKQVPKSHVKTGDTNHLLVYVILMVAASACVAVALLLWHAGKRRKEEK